MTDTSAAPPELPTPDTPYTRAALDVAFDLAASAPEEFQRRVGANIRAFGVCVITGVLPPSECDAHCDALCTSLETMSGFDRRCAGAGHGGGGGGGGRALGSGGGWAVV